MTNAMTTRLEKSSFSNGAGSIIITTSLVAGSLDLLGAIVLHSYILSKAPIIVVLQSIASGVFGIAAFKGGWQIAFYGLFIHFLIALAFTVFYYYMFPYLSLFRKHKIISGLLYGVFAWIIMNIVILPVSRFSLVRFQLNQALPGIFVLMIFFGLPVSFMIYKYYNRNNPTMVSQIYALH